jgi:hypothetical protein
LRTCDHPEAAKARRALAEMRAEEDRKDRIEAKQAKKMIGVTLEKKGLIEDGEMD